MEWRVAGDTCWSLSVSHGLTVDDLLLLNPFVDCTKLQVDVSLCVKATQLKVLSE